MVSKAGLDAAVACTPFALPTNTAPSAAFPSATGSPIGVVVQEAAPAVELKTNAYILSNVIRNPEVTYEAYANLTKSHLSLAPCQTSRI